MIHTTPTRPTTSRTAGRRRLRTVAATVVLAAVVALPTACGSDDSATAGTTSAAGAARTDHTAHSTAASSGKPTTTLDVTTGEFRFDVSSERIQAGLVTISLHNKGALPHQVSLVRLHDDATLDDFLHTMHEDEGRALAMADFAAGVNPVGTGSSSSVRADLEPGTYTLLCFVPNPGGGNHIDKGMVHQVEVVAPEPGTPKVPAPDQVVADVALADFTITPPPGGFAAPGTYRFVNRGEEPHEVVFLRLKDGRTMADAAAYDPADGGEPPFTYEGGPAGMAPGSETYVDLDLRPGSWLALCMLPGAHTGKPHMEMGMLLPFEVPA